jgi:predicted P-loop ATPase
MSSHDKFLIHFSEGRGVNLGKAKNRIAGWGEFVSMLSTPTKTKERRKAFDKMSKDQQDELKAIDGWIMAAQVAEGRRANKNIRPRDLLSLDYDYATPTFVDQIKMGLTPLSDFEFFVHSSRRHTDDKPRIRLFAPLSRPVSPDEFIALARILAMRMEGTTPMRMVDKVSFRPAQMMFKPTTSIDGDWFCHRNKGEMIDPDDVLDGFREAHGDWNDYTLLPLCADEEELRKHADKAEDPTQKKGPVGDFCRAYDVPAAIAKFLPDKYAPADDYSVKPRYTYLLGTSTSGAVVEDDGLFLYSHHGSDPCADRLVNAFDLVRIHLFGDLDEEEEKDTPPTKLPSYKRMVEFIGEDPDYRKSQAESRYDISAMFEDVADETEIESDDEEPDLLGFDDTVDLRGSDSSGSGSPGLESQPKKPKRRKPPKDWFPNELELDQNGRIVSSMPNAAVIIHNDPRLFEGIGFNDFTKQIVCRRSIISKLDIAPAFIVRDPVNGDRWQDFNDTTIRAILEAPNGEGKAGYGMRMTDRDLAGAVTLTARRNTFHPIRDWLDGLVWDGRRRMDTLLIRYLKCPDTAYHREIARWEMIASVARIYEPGHKFDYAIIIQGEQGIRKSSFIKELYGPGWFGEIDCKLDDRQAVAEEIAGKWGVELPELSGFHKSDHNAAKHFMRRQYDDVRMAYDRRVSEFPRQCVFWGTTNDRKYLKDPTGNRSYWPVQVGVTVIDTDRLAGERPQLWAEAVAAYRAMREGTPTGDLPLTLQSPEAINEAKAMQENARSEELHEMWAEKIAEWLDEPVTLREFVLEIGAKIDDKFDEDDASGILVVRCAFHREHVVEHCMKRDRGVADYQTAQNIERAFTLLNGWSQPKDKNKGGARIRVQGVQKRWWLRNGATAEEAHNGYRVLSGVSQSKDLDDYAHLI